MILPRLRIITWVFVVLFIAVDVRLAHLQFVARDFWMSEARATQEDGESVPFRRGALLDRFGKPLAIGEIDQTLNVLAWTFRRETPIGIVVGGMRHLIEHCGRSDLRVPQVHEVVQQPAQWVKALLEMDQARLAQTTQRYAADYGFYARRVLELTEQEFREKVKTLPETEPYRSLRADAVERAVERIEEHAAALDDLARAIGQTRAELLFAIDEKLGEVEEMIRGAVAASATPPDSKQLRAFRRDYENRVQLLARGIPYKAVFLVNMAPGRFTGLSIRDVDSRRYPSKYEDLAPTLIGWVGEATPEVCERTRRNELRLRELESRDGEMIDDQIAREIEQLRTTLRHDDYLPEEQLGREGLEAVLEPVLRGHRGWKIVRRDRERNDIELLDQKPAIDGQDVSLTLDADLTLACQRVLERASYDGAIVLLDPKDGAIRAMASRPSPTRHDLENDYGKLATDDRRFPLFHRAFRTPGNPPPPGSVFKVIVAAAGLESGDLAEYTTADCEFRYEVFGKTLRCLGTHPGIDLKTALAKSCNIFFYKVAPSIGYTAIVDMARRFGIGNSSGFGDPKKLGLEGEARSIGEMAFLPPPKQQSALYLLQTAIGHGGFDDITPLQVATFIAPFANNGYRITPYLVDRIGENEAPRTPSARIGLKSSTLDIIRRAMEMTCEPHGTAGPVDGIDLRRWKVAGKTGTPQEAGDIDHAWFAGYFPHDHPRLVFAILQQNTESGGGRTCRPLLFDLLNQPELEAYVQ
jgi:cell division protein FtsI/penicillin-binding protein 2